MNVKDMYDAGLYVPYERMEPDAVEEVKLRLIDTILALVGGALSSPEDELESICSVMKGAPEVRPAYPAGIKTSYEMAGFMNAWFTRYADWGDTYRRKDGIGGHPSDQIAAILALCDAPGVSGRKIIEAIHFAYQLYAVLQEHMFNTRQFLDYTTSLSITTPLTAAICFNTPPERAQNALNLSAAGGVILGEARRGKTTNLKSGASAYAVARGLWCYRLSEAFLRTPDGIFDGSDGWYKNIAPLTGNIADLKTDTAFASVEVKAFPCFHVGQAPVECAVSLHEQVKDRISQIQGITVWVTEAYAPHIIKAGRLAYPSTQAAADHNVKYCAAVALQYGALTPLHYGPEHLRDERTRRLFDLTEVKVFDSPPEGRIGACKLEIAMKGGIAIEESRERGEGSFTGMEVPARIEKLHMVLAKKQRMLEQISGFDFASVIEAANNLENAECSILLDRIQASIRK